MPLSMAGSSHIECGRQMICHTIRGLHTWQLPAFIKRLQGWDFLQELAAHLGVAVDWGVLLW